MMAANEACQHLLEGVVQEFERPDMSEMQDQMLAFAQCMRDNGVDMPDPEFSEDGGVTIFGGPGDEGRAIEIDPSDPTFQEAQEACNEIFGGQGGMGRSSVGRAPQARRSRRRSASNPLPAPGGRVTPLIPFLGGANGGLTPGNDAGDHHEQKGEPMRLSRLAALAAAVILMAAGCGGSGTSGAGIASLEGQDPGGTTTTAATGTTVDREQAMLDFAQCMRDHGIDMEDPTADENGNFQMMRPSGGGEGGEFDPADREAMQAAREACSPVPRGHRPAVRPPGHDRDAGPDARSTPPACGRTASTCPTPTSPPPNGGGPGARLGFEPGDYDPNDPTFQAANEACQEIFGADGMPGFMGGGPGGGMPPGGGTPPEGGTPPDTDG